MSKENKITCLKCGTKLNIPNEIKKQVEKEAKLVSLLGEKSTENAVKDLEICNLRKILENKEKELQAKNRIITLLEKIEMEKEELAAKTKIENEQILNITKNVKDLTKQLEEQKQVINDLKQQYRKNRKFSFRRINYE